MNKLAQAVRDNFPPGFEQAAKVIADMLERHFSAGSAPLTDVAGLDGAALTIGDRDRAIESMAACFWAALHATDAKDDDACSRIH